MRTNGRFRRARFSALAAALTALALAASAQAEVVTVGAANPGETTNPSACTFAGGCGFLTTAAEAPNAATRAPIDGTVVRWRIAGAAATSGYQVNVVRSNLDGTYTITAAAPPVTLLGPGTEAFAAGLPIKAGEFVELDVPDSGSVGAIEGPSSTIVVFSPALRADQSQMPLEAAAPVVPAFNADIESVQTVPVLPVAPVLPVTPAPPAPLPQAQCVVPKLNGKKLKAAKKKIKAADCKVGLVSKKNGVKVATGKVVKQSPKAGKVLPVRTGVSVKLG